jgi:hypothetical protein
VLSAWRRRSTLASVGPLLICLVFVVAPALLLRRVSDPSPWLHLRVGDYLLGGHRFGTPDPWAPFTHVPYVPTQWLPSVLTARAYAWFGTPVLAWERAAGISLMALLLLWWLSRAARLWLASLLTLLVLVSSWPTLTERPQLAGFLLLLPVLSAWWSTAHDLRARWWLVPLTWVAACTHGVWATGCALGALTVACLMVSRRLTLREALRLFALLAACAAAAALTPIGPRLLLTPFQVGSQGRQFVLEWMPSSVRSPSVALALALAGAIWLLWVVGRRRPAMWELAWWLAAIVLILAMRRTVPIGAFLVAPLLAQAWESGLARGALHHGVPARNRWSWVGAAVVGLAVAAPLAGGRDRTPVGVPTALGPQLAHTAAGSRILVDGDTSGWVLFTAPQLEPVFDLRIESYSAADVRRYIAAMAAEPGWQQYIADRGVTLALVRRDSPIGAGLREQLGWRRSGQDAGLLLLEAP